MRAVSFNLDAAKLMGISTDGIIAVTFALGSALAAAAGVLIGMQIPKIDPLMGIMYGLKAFVAAVLGGHRQHPRRGPGRPAHRRLGGDGRRLPFVHLPRRDRVRNPHPGAAAAAAGHPRPRPEGEGVKRARDRRGRRRRALARQRAARGNARARESRISPYFLQVLCLAGINIILAVSLNLINGFTGQFSIGHAGFMAIGAYSSAFVTVTFGDRLRGGRSTFLPEAGRRRSLLLDRPLRRRRCCAAVRGVPRGRAVAAPARRLPRDRDARVRRDHPRLHPEHRRRRRGARPRGSRSSRTSSGSISSPSMTIVVVSRTGRGPRSAGR